MEGWDRCASMRQGSRGRPEFAPRGISDAHARPSICHAPARLRSAARASSTFSRARSFSVSVSPWRRTSCVASPRRAAWHARPRSVKGRMGRGGSRSKSNPTSERPRARARAAPARARTCTRLVATMRAALSPAQTCCPSLNAQYSERAAVYISLYTSSASCAAPPRILPGTDSPSRGVSRRTSRSPQLGAKRFHRALTSAKRELEHLNVLVVRDVTS